MQKHVLITGANRGIGLAFVKSYLDKGDKVTACVRSLDDSNELRKLCVNNSSLQLKTLDVTDNIKRQLLVEELDENIDILINNAGLYGGTKQDLSGVNEDIWLQVLKTNTMAPFFLTQALLPKLKSEAKLVFISSKMGSIADNSSGGAYIYRSSKAALNALTKSLSHDLYDSGKTVLTFHPGWVKTRMGGPNALIDADESVHGIVEQIENAGLKQSGQFFSFDGQPIPW